LLLVSFLLPFFLFECSGPGFGPSKKEREAGMTKAKQDSINAAVEAQIKADSIAYIEEQKRINDSIKQRCNKAQLDSINEAMEQARIDSIKTLENKNSFELNKPIETKVKQEDKIINKLWEHMQVPTKNSLSGLGLTVFAIQFELLYLDYRGFKIRDLLEFLIPLNLLFALILLLLVIFKKIKLSRIFSIISLLFFIIAVFLYQNQGILWGFWVAFILNMIDLILVNLILYKPKVE
jgi:hypothetical protein